jgi:hypothetical protein
MTFSCEGGAQRGLCPVAVGFWLVVLVLEAVGQANFD